MMRKLFTQALLFSLAMSSLSAGASESSAPSVPPPKALEELKAGNKRFIEGKALHTLSDPTRRKELAAGQHPSTIILSCSDSRVPPELVFDKGLGELFTVRVAGNVLGAATVASIEYAVEHLGANLILILGHESCGAVKAAISTPMGQSAGSPDLDSLVATLKPALRDFSRGPASASDDKTLRKPVMANVDAVGARLLERSRIVRKRVQEGKVAVVHGIYGLESGQVDFWHEEGLEPRK